MSSSGNALNIVKLVADARFPTATVSIMDGRYGMVAEALGRVEVSLPVGIYLVEFKAGDMYERHTVELSTDTTILAQKLVPPSAPAPSTGNTGPAVADSGGKSSLLYLSVEGEGANQVLQRLQVLYASQEIVADFSSAGPGATERSLGLEPGVYLLRLRTDDGDYLEQTLVACEGWQLQIFFRMPSLRDRKMDWPRLLGQAPILMLPLDADLAHYRRDREWIQEALENLSSNRPKAPVAELQDAVNIAANIEASTPDPATVRQMLKLKFTDPMLGLLGAHQLIHGSEPERALLQSVVKNLDILLPGHPDVTALKLWLGTVNPGDLSFPLPPMLRSSWRIIVNKTAETPGLVAAGSYAARAAGRVTGAGGWLVWNTPAPGQTMGTSSEPIEDLLNRVRQQLAALAGKSPSELRVFAQSSALSSLEVSIVGYLNDVARSEATGRDLVASLYKPGFMGALWTITQQILPGVSLVAKDKILDAANQLVLSRLSREQMIQNLEIPDSALVSALSDLTQKLPALSVPAV